MIPRSLDGECRAKTGREGVKLSIVEVVEGDRSIDGEADTGVADERTGAAIFLGGPPLVRNNALRPRG